MLSLMKASQESFLNHATFHLVSQLANQGHVPSAVNVPYTLLLGADGTLLPKDELRKVFVDCRVNLNKPVVTMCGSGVTAAILYLALDIIGVEHVRLYDGSWSEWAGSEKSPIIRYAV